MTSFRSRMYESIDGNVTLAIFKIEMFLEIDKEKIVNGIMKQILR